MDLNEAAKTDAEFLRDLADLLRGSTFEDVADRLREIARRIEP